MSRTPEANGRADRPFFEVVERGLDTVEIVTVSTSTAATVAESLGLTVHPREQGAAPSEATDN